MQARRWIVIIAFFLLLGLVLYKIWPRSGDYNRILVHVSPAAFPQPKMTVPQFVRLIEEVPLGTTRENVVVFLDKHNIENTGHRKHFTDEYVHAFLNRHESLGWYPSIQADYKFKRNKLTGYQFKEFHQL